MLSNLPTTATHAADIAVASVSEDTKRRADVDEMEMIHVAKNMQTTIHMIMRCVRIRPLLPSFRRDSAISDFRNRMLLQKKKKNKETGYGGDGR